MLTWPSSIYYCCYSILCVQKKTKKTLFTDDDRHFSMVKTSSNIFGWPVLLTCTNRPISGENATKAKFLIRSHTYLTVDCGSGVKNLPVVTGVSPTRSRKLARCDNNTSYHIVCSAVRCTACACCLPPALHAFTICPKSHSTTSHHYTRFQSRNSIPKTFLFRRNCI